MSCYSCGSSFGLFKKELGCKNCGYAFCKDCLSKKAAVPKLKNEKHKVCVKCYKILTGQAPPEVKVNHSPPEALRKRMAKLDQQSSNSEPRRPTGETAQKSPPIVVTKGMTKEDISIATRLQNLKDSRKQDSVAPPSEQEMSARLARLKGKDPDEVHKPHVFKSDKRPQVQQVDDLLQEICDEVEIDSHQINYAEDVQDRLNRFKGQDSKPADLDNDPAKHRIHHTKNIPHIDKDYKPSSGEHVDWSEMNQLVNQVANELEVDANKAIEGLQKDKELWERLSKMKQKKPVSSNTTTDTDRTPEPEEEAEEEEKNEEEACKNIIKQLLEESRIEDSLEDEELTGRKMNMAPSVPMETNTHNANKKVPVARGPEIDPDELPYCCICNNDASLRCMGCEGDLYCARCYKEGHDREDYKDHRTKSYKTPSKK